jgi:hypothetical protein
MRNEAGGVNSDDSEDDYDLIPKFLRNPFHNLLKREKTTKEERKRVRTSSFQHQASSVEFNSINPAPRRIPNTINQNGVKKRRNLPNHKKKLNSLSYQTQTKNQSQNPNQTLHNYQLLWSMVVLPIGFEQKYVLHHAQS